MGRYMVDEGPGPNDRTETIPVTSGGGASKVASVNIRVDYEDGGIVEIETYGADEALLQIVSEEPAPGDDSVWVIPTHRYRRLSLVVEGPKRSAEDGTVLKVRQSNRPKTSPLLDGLCRSRREEAFDSVCEQHNWRWEHAERFCNGVLGSFSEIAPDFLDQLRDALGEK